MRHRALPSLLALAALVLGGCGKHPAAQVDAVTKLKPVAKPVAMSVEERDQAFPTSVAKVKFASVGKEFLVVRFQAAKLGFAQSSKIGFPVLVRGQEQFKSNLYLADDRTIYISDLGTAAKPRFWRVGLYGVPSMVTGRPNEGDRIYVTFIAGIEMDMGLKAVEGAPSTLSLAMQIHSTPFATSAAPLWSEPLDGVAPVAAPAPAGEPAPQPVAPAPATPVMPYAPSAKKPASTPPAS